MSKHKNDSLVFSDTCRALILWLTLYGVFVFSFAHVHGQPTSQFNVIANDIDYENKTNKELSFTFDNDIQNQLITDAMLWLGKTKKRIPVLNKRKRKNN